MLSIDNLSIANITRIFTNIRVVDGCWEWCGYRIPQGYGRMRLNGREILLHRLLYAWAVEPLPLGNALCLDHLCRNRACCNPSHLELVSLGENLRRASRSGVPRKSYEVNPNPRTGVYFSPKTRKKWMAKIMVNGTRHYLGLHATVEEAAVAYRQKASELGRVDN